MPALGSATVLTGCPYCHAAPGEPCVAVTFGPIRQPVGFTHVERTRADVDQQGA